MSVAADAINDKRFVMMDDRGNTYCKVDTETVTDKRGITNY